MIGASTVYWGYSATATPTAAQVQALAHNKSHGPYCDSYEFNGPAAGRYVVIAFPVEVGITDVFFEGSVFGNFNTTSAALTVGSNQITYVVFVSATRRYELGDLTVAARARNTIAYLTSQIYPVEFVDAMQGAMVLVSGYTTTIPLDGLDSSMTLQSGVLAVTTAYQTYSNWPPEALDAGMMTLVSGVLTVTTGYQTYSNWPAEGLDAGMMTLLSGSLVVTAGYVTYNNWPPEGLDSSMTLLSGSLT